METEQEKNKRLEAQVEKMGRNFQLAVRDATRRTEFLIKTERGREIMHFHESLYEIEKLIDPAKMHRFMTIRNRLPLSNYVQFHGITQKREEEINNLQDKVRTLKLALSTAETKNKHLQDMAIKAYSKGGQR